MKLNLVNFLLHWFLWHGKIVSYCDINSFYCAHSLIFRYKMYYDDIIFVRIVYKLIIHCNHEENSNQVNTWYNYKFCRFSQLKTIRLLYGLIDWTESRGICIVYSAFKIEIGNDLNFSRISPDLIGCSHWW